MYRTLLPTLSLLLSTCVAWGPGSSPLPQCSPRVISLATGIFINIGGQHSELNTTIALQELESTPSFDQTTFEVMKGELIAEIMGGMSIRAFNQAVAPPGNAALPGLAIYAAAQSTELGLAQSLTGQPSNDLPILNTIHNDVVAGTQLNEYNLGNATEGCSLGFDLTS